MFVARVHLIQYASFGKYNCRINILHDSNEISISLHKMIKLNLKVYVRVLHRINDKKYEIIKVRIAYIHRAKCFPKIPFFLLNSLQKN